MSALALASPVSAIALDGIETPAAVEQLDQGVGTQPKEDASEKVATPVPKKWVLEDSTGEWVEAADRSMNERFSYRIDGSMQGDMHDYETYEWWLVDTLPAGTDLAESSVKVTLVKADGTERDVREVLDVTYENRTLKVGTADILTAIEDISADDVIRVEYEATINADFKVGVSDPNDNFCHIDHTTPITGKGTVSSPEVRARAVTWELGVSKHEQGSTTKMLSGAVFELADENGKKLATVTTDAKGQASVVGLDSGKYVLTETKAPVGYTKTDPISFEILPEWDGIELGSLKVTAKGADAKSEASEGTVTLSVADAKEETKKGTTTTGGGTSIGRTISSALPKTGDVRIDALLYTLVGVGLVAIGAGIWFKRKDKKDDESTRGA